MTDVIKDEILLADYRFAAGNEDELPDFALPGWKTTIEANSEVINLTFGDPSAPDGELGLSQSVMVELDMACPKVILGPQGAEGLLLIRMAGDRMVIEHMCTGAQIIVNRDGWRAVTMSPLDLESLNRPVVASAPSLG